MARPDDFISSLEQLRAASSPAQKLAALRQLKNDIIGHADKKEAVILGGGVEYLADLCKIKRGHGKTRSNDAEWAGLAAQQIAESLETGDEIRLQALYIITSLVNVGKPFVAPIVAGSIFPSLLTALSVTTPPRILTESLRAISIIVFQLADDLIGDYQDVRRQVFEQIFTSPQTLGAFSRILIQDYTNRYSDTQFTLTLRILEGLCRNDDSKGQNALVAAGILDLLASKLAAWIVTNQPEFKSNDHQTLLQTHPPPKLSFPDITRVIALIVKNSRYLCARLFYSRDLVAIFPLVPKFDVTAVPETPALSRPFGGLPWRSWAEYLPKITPAPLKDLNSRAFPSLGYESARVPFVDLSAPTFGVNPTLDDSNSDLLAWLATMSRHCEGRERLCTLFLFSTLLRYTKLNTRFERPLAFLVIPMLVRLIEEGGWSVMIPKTEELSPPYLYPENILTNMALGSSSLQVSAYDADAIKMLCGLLKKLFDPRSDRQSTMWGPVSVRKRRSHSLANPNLLGPPVLSTRLSNTIHHRLAVLSVLSTICEKEDVTRKEIINNGIIALSTDALTPYPERMISDETWPTLDNIDPKEGNPTSVLIATLAFLRTMARSTHILRTSLMDGGIAKPVFTLLRHNNMEVRIAATDAVTNLVTAVSPMRGELLRSGVIKVLSEHAHSADSRLKVSALWALKNMVPQSSWEVTREVFEELGSGFIFQLLTGEPATKGGKHLASANAYGERVDLLNDDDEPNMNLDSSQELDYNVDDDEHAITDDDDDDDSLYRSDSNRPKHFVNSRFGPSRVYTSRLKILLASERGRSHRAKKMDIRIQHHTLGILRNITGNPTAHQPDLIDMVLNSMGATRYIAYLVSKLHPQVRYDPEMGDFLDTEKDATERAVVAGAVYHKFGPQKSRTEFLAAEDYAHPDLVEGAVCCLTHIANGTQSHKQLVMSAHPKIIPYLSRLLAHPDYRVRTGILWLVHNLIWVEGPDDRHAACTRGWELRKHGLEDKIKDVQNDKHRDIRERAKADLEQFAELLESGSQDFRRPIRSRIQSLDAVVNSP